MFIAIYMYYHSSREECSVSAKTLPKKNRDYSRKCHHMEDQGIMDPMADPDQEDLMVDLMALTDPHQGLAVLVDATFPVAFYNRANCAFVYGVLPTMYLFTIISYIFFKFD